MIQKLSLILTTILLLLGSVLTASAQDGGGTISGTVYLSDNPNGTCTEDNLPGQSGIQIQVIDVDNDTTVNLTTNSDGTYEFITSIDGTYQVTVNPGASWRVLTQQTRQIVISEDSPDHEDIDFCIAQVPATPTSTAPTPMPTFVPTPIPTQPPTLPQSGAAIAPSLLLIAGLGVLLIIGGLFIFKRS
ncbi:MAG: carboxypeptidase-like regulatory domain-containing protein [Candidatus Promineifilaceae bacterium]